MSTGRRDEASILHVDMDAFYAAVEVRRDPSLAGRPVIVGGTAERGVVASCSYEARAYGVRSAMPATQARRLCPHAVFLPGNYDDYSRVSRQIHDVFHSFTPLVEGIALDEAFLDVAGARRLFGTGEQIAHRLREQVREATGLSCSVGVATTKFLAKLASEAAKPVARPTGTVPGRGVVVVEPGEELAFLHPLPVRALWGVGPATHARLHRLGVETVGDLAAVPVESLVAALGRASARHLHELAWGRDPRAVVPNAAAKSIGHEETYAKDLFADADVHRELIRLADGVAGRLRKAGKAGRTISVKLRFADFTTITRSHTVPAPVDAGPVIAHVAVALVDSVERQQGVRLLGVTVSNLQEPGGEQLSFDEAAKPAGWQRAADAIESVRARFGDQAVAPAALLGRTGVRVKRQGDTQWGPAAETPPSALS